MFASCSCFSRSALQQCMHAWPAQTLCMGAHPGCTPMMASCRAHPWLPQRQQVSLRSVHCCWQVAVAMGQGVVVIRWRLCRLSLFAVGCAIPCMLRGAWDAFCHLVSAGLSQTPFLHNLILEGATAHNLSCCRARLPKTCACMC